MHVTGITRINFAKCNFFEIDFFVKRLQFGQHGCRGSPDNANIVHEILYHLINALFPTYQAIFASLNG